VLSCETPSFRALALKWIVCSPGGSGCNVTHSPSVDQPLYLPAGTPGGLGLTKGSKTFFSGKVTLK
jgi:hypothetical protein